MRLSDYTFLLVLWSVDQRDFTQICCVICLTVHVCSLQNLQVAQKEAQIRLLEGQLRQTDVIGSSHNHMILDALREKAECIPELQALIHNVQQGM